MLRLSLNLDAATLYRAKDGRIGGKIYFQAGNFFFPENTWGDFPVPLLTSWLEGALAVVEGRQTEFFCRFLDGPFRATLGFESSHVWNAFFIEDRLYGPELRRRESFDSASFLFSLFSCSDIVSEHCSANLWQSPYIDQLNAQRKQWRKHI